MSNADAPAPTGVGPAEVRDHCPVDDAGKSLLRVAMQQLHMSARAYNELSPGSLHPEAGPDGCGPFETLRAGLAGATRSDGTGAIETVPLAEAIQYRPARQDV